jgi:hypothetical protein
MIEAGCSAEVEVLLVRCDHPAGCLFSLLKPYVWVFRGISKTTLPGDVGFLQFLRNVYQLTAFEQAEMILYAA